MFYRILSFGRGGGGTPKFSVDVEEHVTTRGVWGHAPPDFSLKKKDAPRLILRHSGGTSSQF